MEEVSIRELSSRDRRPVLGRLTGTVKSFDCNESSLSGSRSKGDGAFVIEDCGVGMRSKAEVKGRREGGSRAHITNKKSRAQAARAGDDNDRSGHTVNCDKTARKKNSTCTITTDITRRLGTARTCSLEFRPGECVEGVHAKDVKVFFLAVGRSRDDGCTWHARATGLGIVKTLPSLLASTSRSRVRPALRS